jgi:hypothetical protein
MRSRPKVNLFGHPEHSLAIPSNFANLILTEMRQKRYFQKWEKFQKASLRNL